MPGSLEDLFLTRKRSVLSPEWFGWHLALGNGLESALDVLGNLDLTLQDFYWKLKGMKICFFELFNRLKCKEPLQESHQYRAHRGDQQSAWMDRMAFVTLSPPLCPGDAHSWCWRSPGAVSVPHSGQETQHDDIFIIREDKERQTLCLATRFEH